MAIINRLYFDTPDYTASYDYNDQTLKLVAVHATNRTSNPLVIGIFDAATDTELQEFTIPANTTLDQSLTPAQQRNVTLTSTGKVSNLYAKTIS